MKTGQRELKTWAEKGSFLYEGAINAGVLIHFGEDFKYSMGVSRDQCQQILHEFTGKSIAIGTSRDNPPTGSLGQWLMENVSKTAITSYLGSILVYEGYAAKEGSNIRFA